MAPARPWAYRRLIYGMTEAAAVIEEGEPMPENKPPLRDEPPPIGERQTDSGIILP